MALILYSHRALARCLLGLACIAAATLSPFAHAQPPAKAPFPWIDIHLHLIGGRGQQQDFGGALNAALTDMDRSGVTQVPGDDPFPLAAGP